VVWERLARPPGGTALASPTVSLYSSSLCITSCSLASLLTPCWSQGNTCGLPPGWTDHHDQALGLQTPETVTEVPWRPGQRRDQRGVTTRAHPPGPLLIGNQPPEYPPLASCEPHASHHCAPARRCARRGSDLGGCGVRPLWRARRRPPLAPPWAHRVDRGPRPRQCAECSPACGNTPLARREATVGDAPLDRRGTVLQLLGRWGERAPGVPLHAMREARVIPDTRHTVRSPRFPRPHPRAQAMERGRNGQGAAALGELTDDLKAIVLGRPAMLPRRRASHPPLGMPPTGPVERQAMLGRLLGGVAHHLLQHGAPTTFFARRWGGGLAPHRAQVVAKVRNAWCCASLRVGGWSSNATSRASASATWARVSFQRRSRSPASRRWSGATQP
jgi:hypothetical protein